MRTIFTRTVACGVILCGAVVTTSACAHWHSAARTKLASTVTADALIVSLADVRRIAGVDDLVSNPRADKHQPYHLNSEPPGTCRVFDPHVAFGNDWTQFRSVGYTGLAYPPLPGLPAPTPVPPGYTGAIASAPPKPLMIIQAIGIYPYEGTARGVFDRLIPALSACSALHAKYYDFTIDEPDSSTVVLNHGGESMEMYHVMSSVLLHVSAAGFPDAARITGSVFREIVTHIQEIDE